jgi:hypothetical protein
MFLLYETTPAMQNTDKEMVIRYIQKVNPIWYY